MVDRSRSLSPHYVLGDFLVDSTFPQMADELDPPDRVVANLARLTTVIERMVEAFAPKWRVLSGYRDAKLNDACREAGLPASVESLHLSGCAADLQPADDVDIEVVFEWLKEQVKADLPLHEAVYYPLKGFIHVAVDDPENPTPKRLLMRT